jgi:hypothetical protein
MPKPHLLIAVLMAFFLSLTSQTVYATITNEKDGQTAKDASVTITDSNAPKKIKKFKIGVSYLNSYPLFSFVDVKDKGIGWRVLEKFAEKNNIEFEYIAMPMTRLQTAMDNGAIDFIFPDNPLWVAYRSNRTPNIYSGPLLSVTSSTFVREENKHVPISDIEKVAIPFGYTAITWVEPIKKYDIQSIPVRDLESALHRLRQGTADAADVEYNIAKHIIESDPRLTGLTINKNLPNISVDYHMSSIKHIMTLEKLTAFMQKEKAFVEALKKEYNIKTHAEVFGPAIP